MRQFSYVAAADVGLAVDLMTRTPGARYLAGGTNLVDLIREGVEQPVTLIDVTSLPLTGIEELPGGGLRIGALVRNSDLAASPLVRARFPVVAQAVLAGASAQIRNMATTGGNLVQRTRCGYFYDLAAACNKREPGTGCAALGGFNRMHAVLGASDRCIAVHPSDLGVALAALDAVVEVAGPNGVRRITLADLYRGPADAPDRETVLQPADLITAVEIPGLSDAANSQYRKVRDRASYAFALVSVAAVLRVEDAVVARVRLALGGVAPRPWRAHLAERELLGRPATEESFSAAAEAELAPAACREHNAFKPELARRTIVAALRRLTTQPGAP
jgi:xanthine dehydrogenase YagS FAD-binding subunit